MMNMELKGSCLCGQVTWTVKGPFSGFHLCHCSRCRKDTGSAHASNLFALPGNIHWLSGQNQIKRFDLPEAKRFSTCFCIECGSSVPYVSRNGQTLIIPAGGLDDDPGVVPEDNIFWEDRTDWYEQGLKSEKFESYPDKS